MNSILETISAERTSSTTFRPRTPNEHFALRLAQKLGDAPVAAHYVKLVEHYPEGLLLAAYRRTTAEKFGGDLGRKFHLELQTASPMEPVQPLLKLLALRVSRRAVAAAVYCGQQLDYTQIRQLSSSTGRALESALMFVAWLVDHFSPKSAALEVLTGQDECQSQLLNQGINSLLRERLVSLWEVPKRELLVSFGYPPLKSRKELRNVIDGMWPLTNGNRNGRELIQDAVALGQFVQVERYFV